jgi:hypothetical protein
MNVTKGRPRARLAVLAVIVVNLVASLGIATPALAAPDFQVLIEPDSQLLPPGGSVSFQIQVGSIEGFNQPVSLEVGPLPPGVASVLSQDEVTPPGTSTLTLIAAEDAETGSFQLSVTATSGAITHVASGSVTVDFGLVPICYGSLEGTVTDEETGAPIAGVTILGVLITDANGHWGPYQAGLGTNNSPAFYSVRAQMAGYWDRSGDATAICDQTTRVDIQLLKMQPAAIFGVVVEAAVDPDDPTVVIPNGPAIEGVQISVQFFPDPPMFPVDTSAADGSYHIDLDHLNPDNQPLADVHLRAVLDGFWPRDFGAPSPLPIGDLAANQEKQVDPFGLVRQCTGSISGSVTYADTGEPAAEVTVTAGHLWEFKSTQTNALGEFSFPALLLGYNNQPVDFGVSAAGSDLYIGDSATVHLDACGEHGNTEIALKPTGPFGNLEGHVYDEDTGEPVAGVMVGPIGGCHPCITDNATTDATGYYRIDRMPADFAPAIYSIITGHPDYWQSGDQVEVVADDTVTLDLQILKRRFAEVTGQVRDAISGLPIEGASIGFAPSAVQSDANGNYISPKLEVGFRNEPLEIAVGAGAAGYWPREERVVLRPDQQSELDFELIPICDGATVRGTVVDAVTHDPIANAQVFTSGGGFDLTDENGDYLIEGISVGINNSPIEATVTATADGYHPQSRTITVFCGGSFTIEFGPEPPVSALEGYVTNAVTGDPIAGVFIGAEFGDMTTTDVDGYYLFDEVPLHPDGTSRTWTITAAPNGFDSQTKSVTVEPNLTARLDFVFGTPVQAPNLSVTKTPTPAQVPAGGGTVAFGVSVTNVGGSATLTNLVDDVFGDLDGVGSCSAPQQLANGGTYSCSFSEEVTGTPGTEHVNTVTATAVNDGGTDQASGSATVEIMDNVDPVLAVTKDAEPTSLPEPGGIFTFNVTITNNSASSDPVTLTSLSDDVYGELTGDLDCQVGTVLAAGAVCAFSFTGDFTGNIGDEQTDTVEACGVDDEETPVCADDPATVTIAAVSGAVLLIIDDDGLDNGIHYNRTGGGIVPSGPDFFAIEDVNDDKPDISQRDILRFFEQNVDATITVKTGQTGDEGWFAPNCIPQKWISGKSNTCLEAGTDRSMAINHYFGANALAAIPAQNRLDKIPAVIPLRARGLVSLIGQTVCGVVYDSDISINYDRSTFPFTTGNLQGETLGIVAFKVNEVRKLNGFSSSTLPEVQLTILDTSVCGNWFLFNAPVPKSSSVPNDIDPQDLSTNYRNSTSFMTRPDEELFY